MTTTKQLAAQIIGLLESDPNGWELSEYTATYGQVRLWIANAPYADIEIGGVRIGTRWQRRKIRRLIAALWIAEQGRKLESAAVEYTIARMERAEKKS